MRDPFDQGVQFLVIFSVFRFAHDSFYNSVLLFSSFGFLITSLYLLQNYRFVWPFQGQHATNKKASICLSSMLIHSFVHMLLASKIRYVFLDAHITLITFVAWKNQLELTAFTIGWAVFLTRWDNRLTTHDDTLSMMIDLQEVDWQIIRLAFSVIAIVSVLGVFLNSLLFITTVKSSNLRSTCNILIGCCSLFDVIHQVAKMTNGDDRYCQIGSLEQFPLLFADYFIDSAVCSALQASFQFQVPILLPEICVSAGVLCVFNIGLDRLLSALGLVSFRAKRKWLYLTFHFVAIAIYCSYTVYLMVAYYVPQHVICSIPAPFHGASVVKWNQAMSIANILSVAVYATTWMVLRKTEASTDSRRLFRAICIVMAIDVAGWTITTFILHLVFLFDLKDGTRFALHYVAGIPVNSGVAFKAIVYYQTSAEYRSAFQNVLKITTLVPFQTTQYTIKTTTRNIK